MNLSALDPDELTPRAIVSLRQAACQNDSSVALELITALRSLTSTIALENETPRAQLVHLLRLLFTFSRLDPTLSQELAHQGSHTILLNIMNNIHLQDEHEEDLDLIHELCDDIASLYTQFPVTTNLAPYSQSELLQRLPLEFVLQDDLNEACYLLEPTILMHQVVTTRQSAQEDVGFVLWPSAVVLSRWLERNQNIWLPQEQPDNDNNSNDTKRVKILELGAGCGLVGLVAAALVGVSCDIIMSDFNATVLSNIKANIELNPSLKSCCSVMHLDFYQPSFDESSQVDIILAADMICQPADAFAVAKTLSMALQPGGCAYMVCATSDHRFGVECLAQACRDAGIDMVVSNVDLETEIQTNKMLANDLEHCSGYVEGMQLQMFTASKAVDE